MKLRYIFIVALMLIVQCIVYDLFFMNNQSKAPDIEERINSVLAEADDVTREWLDGSADQQFIDNLWKQPLPDAWKEHGISVYLYQSDSLRYWGNHIFRYEIDSVTSPYASSIELFDGNAVLSFRTSKGDRQATVVLTLVSRVDWFNQYIFTSESRYPQLFVERPSSMPDDRQIEQVTVRGRKFYAEVSTTRQMPIAVNLLGWIGIMLFLWSIQQIMRRGVTRKNAVKRLAFTFIIFAVLRLILYWVDIPNGGSLSWSSLGSLLITYCFVLLLIREAYSMRFHLRAQVRTWSWYSRYLAIGFAALYMCAVIVYFHYSMVALIRVNIANVEIYNIFSLNFDSLIFYSICAVFVAMRMLYIRLIETVLYQHPYWIKSLLSVVMLLIMVIPLESQLFDTGFLLVIFHALFLSVYFIARRKFVGRQFIYDLIVFTAYITFFSAIETFSARMETADNYASRIASDPSWEQCDRDQPPKSLWFAVVKPDAMVLSENNNYELLPLLSAASFRVDTTIVRDGITHIVRHRTSDGATIVVSFERPTFVRIVSLWSYIFLWLLIVSGTILQLCGLLIYRYYSHRSMIYRVRMMIFLMVIFSMGVVSVVVYQYSDQAYKLQQKSTLKVSVQELRNNFNAFAESDSSDSLVMRRWLRVSNSSRTSLISIFDTAGVRIGGGQDLFFLSRMSSEAYGALRYGGMPYFERLSSSFSQEYAIAYTSLYWHKHLVGYMGVVHLNPHDAYRKYALLSSIFNLFVIVLLMSIFVSMVLYTAITRPLNVLYEGLSGVRNLKKIDLDDRFHPNDEISTIITQYNAMIDYLEESYHALARSEREAAWREMARQVAHEIKNPLTPMRLKIQMLQRARENGIDRCDEQLDSTLAVLLEQIDILSRIASEFSDLARLPEGALVRIELSGLLSNAVGLYSSSECVEVRYYDLTESKVYVNVDYASMSRVVVNLLQNAIQAIIGSGEVSVTLYVSGRFAVVEVRDNGVGILPEVMGRIFEPNFTTKTRGSGLGLAICRQTVENFGGSISASNVEDGGAVFTVMLPLV